jgi:hypothetical protein
MYPYFEDFSTTCNNSTNCWKTPGYSVAYYVENYKTLLTNNGVTIKNARLLTYAEATDASIGCSLNTWKCPTTGFITNTTFWLGSTGTVDHVWYVSISGTFYSSDYYNDYYNGVRPIIVVEKSNI